jgi:hypothetical protein
MQTPHTRPQITLLITDRDHYVNGGAAGSKGLPFTERRRRTQQ